MEKFKAASPEKKRTPAAIKSEITRLKKKISGLESAASRPEEGIARITEHGEQTFNAYANIEQEVLEAEERIRALERELALSQAAKGDSKEGDAGVADPYAGIGDAYDVLHEAEQEREAKVAQDAEALASIQHQQYEVPSENITFTNNAEAPKSEKDVLQLTDDMLVTEKPPEKDAATTSAYEKQKFTPEELERMAKRVEAMGERKEEVVADAEKRGSWIGRKVRGVGEWYKKQPLWKKAAVTVAIAGGGLWGGGVLAGAAGVAMFGKRIAVGASAFVAIEAALKKSKEKKERFWNKHPSEYAAILALLIGSGLPQAAEAFVGDDEVRGVIQEEVQKPIDTIVNKDALDAFKPEASFEMPGPTESDLIHQDSGASELPGPSESDLIHADQNSVTAVYEDYGNSDPRQVGVSPESVGIDEDYGNSDPRQESVAPEAAPAVIETNVKSGDSLWKIIEHDPRMEEHLRGLSPEQRVYAIDAIKDQFAKMDPAQLRELGIGSGHIDKLAIGETLNLGSVLDNKSLLEGAHNGALKLTPEQLANIKRNIS